MGQELVPVQAVLPVVHQEIDGIEMGVLADGTPYLTGRSLARLCGKAPSVILSIGLEWDRERFRPRGQAISELVANHDYRGPLFIETEVNGARVKAHPDAVCMAILEYYAFLADGDSRTAVQNYRLLARHSLRQFIYGRLGYDPQRRVPDKWSKFHDRMMLNKFPVGYFSVFREIADIILSLIQQGMDVDEHTVPDISVGKTWGTCWTESGFEGTYGPRQKYPHVYPDYFPQKDVVEAWVYPLAALGEFRIWLQGEYLPKKFPSYLKRKAQQGALPPSSVELIVAAVIGEGHELLDGNS